MPILGWQSNFSEALIQVKKQQFNVKFWSWGPTTIWHNMTGVQFFSSKITPQSCTGPWQPWRGDPLHGGALIIYILYTRGKLLGSCRFPCPSWQFFNGKLCTLSQNYSLPKLAIFYWKTVHCPKIIPKLRIKTSLWRFGQMHRYTVCCLKTKTGPTDYLWDSVGGCI